MRASLQNTIPTSHHESIPSNQASAWTSSTHTATGLTNLRLTFGYYQTSEPHRHSNHHNHLNLAWRASIHNNTGPIKGGNDQENLRHHLHHHSQHNGTRLGAPNRNTFTRAKHEHCGRGRTSSLYRLIQSPQPSEGNSTHRNGPGEPRSTTLLTKFKAAMIQRPGSIMLTTAPNTQRSSPWRAKSNTFPHERENGLAAEEEHHHHPSYSTTTTK